MSDEAKKLAEHASEVAAEAAALAAQAEKPVATADQGASPHLDAPAALEHPAAGQPSTSPETQPQAAASSDDEYADACASGKPRVALVGKYGDRVPVQLKNADHLDTLRREHGESNVAVLP